LNLEDAHHRFDFIQLILTVIAVGGDLHPQTLLAAYRRGIFPWPADGYPMLWFCPEERAVLEFKHLHLPRSLRRAQRQVQFEFSIDRAFAEVIRACASRPRPDQDGTWITPEIIVGFTRFHQLGHAHSVEAWLDGRLVGGAYGVSVDGAFAAESMFYDVPNASKFALLHLIEHLQVRGLDWIDIQVLTPHMVRLGAREIGRDEFLERLAATRAKGLKLFVTIQISNLDSRISPWNLEPESGTN
jgi:leucyl/phenylalanyl-tRNA--protein transferase